MRRHRSHIRIASAELSSALVLSVFFLVGGLVGCLVAFRVGGGGDDSLAAYIKAYLAAGVAGEAAAPSVFTLFWDSYRYPLLAALFGFTALGVVLLPILMAVRGFFLCFAVASFVRMFGGTGLGLAAGIFGISCLMTVPCLFVIAVQGFPAALKLAGMAGEHAAASLYDRRAPMRFLVCAAVLFCNVLFSRFAAPVLLSWLASAWGIVA